MLTLGQHSRTHGDLTERLMAFAPRIPARPTPTSFCSPWPIIIQECSVRQAAAFASSVRIGQPSPAMEALVTRTPALPLPAGYIHLGVAKEIAPTLRDLGLDPDPIIKEAGLDPR